MGVSCVPRSVVVQRVLGLVLAAVFVVGAVWALGRTPAPRPSAASPPTGSSTAPTSAGPAAVATSGPGLTEPGIHVVAQAGADGGLEVVERVRLPAAATI